MKSTNTNHWETTLIVKSRQDRYIHYVLNSPGLKNKPTKHAKKQKDVIWLRNPRALIR